MPSGKDEKRSEASPDTRQPNSADSKTNIDAEALLSSLESANFLIVNDRSQALQVIQDRLRHLQNSTLTYRPGYVSDESDSKTSESSEASADTEPLLGTSPDTPIVISSKFQNENPPEPKSTTSSPTLYRGTQAQAKLESSGGTATQSTRPRTAIGPQAEHVSAYVLYEELIYEAIEGVEFSQAGHCLYNSLLCLDLSDTELEKINAQNAKILEKVKQNIPREERKQITRTLRCANYLVQAKSQITKWAQDSGNKASDTKKKGKYQNIQKAIEGLEISNPTEIKEAIRTANRAMIAPEIEKFIDVCLLGANKLQHACFPKEGTPVNPYTGKEKEAKNNLRLLCDFIEILHDISAIPITPQDAKLWWQIFVPIGRLNCRP